MSSSDLARRWFGRPRAVIGMVHLLPLPGSPRAVEMAAVREAALADAFALMAGGVDALMIENFRDTPFYKDTVPAVTLAAMAVVVDEIRRRTAPAPVGVNVLRNDGRSALALAAATGASFIRVNVLSGAMLTDQGVVEGRAAELMRDRAALGLADRVAILADVLVKHAAPLAAVRVEQVVEDTVERAMADAVIVSGTGTGAPTPPGLIEVAAASARGRPVLVGSGVTEETVAQTLQLADAVIVGTALKRGGRADGPVDEGLVRAFMSAARRE